jgi:uncharacterized membrane protein YkvA (DUF1232 family)
MGRLESLKAWAGRLKTELRALYLAYGDPRVPTHARVLAIVVVAYAFSPIDLIPDPIPVLGYLDDLILIPLGIALTIRMIPPDVLAECRAKARNTEESKRGRRARRRPWPSWRPGSSSRRSPYISSAGSWPSRPRTWAGPGGANGP